MADQLTMLAGVVVARVKPKRRDREDCRQTAYLAGLLAVRTAEEKGNKTNGKMLILAMQSAVYRMLNQPRLLTEADLGSEVFESI